MLMSTAMFSQEESWLPMLEEGRVWHTMKLFPAEEKEATCEDFYGRPCTGFAIDYAVEGVQEVNGKTYMRLVQKGYNNITYPIRQDGSKIYMGMDGSEDMLIYDFSLKEGDIFHFDTFMSLYTFKVKTVCIDGVDRRCLWMHGYDEESGYISDIPADIWVEGIGGIATGPCFIYNLWMTSDACVIDECSQDKQLLFSFNDFNKMEPITHIGATPQSHEVFHFNTYDLQGRRLTAEPTHGIFIKDGRKYVRTRDH